MGVAGAVGGGLALAGIGMQLFSSHKQNEASEASAEMAKKEAGFNAATLREQANLAEKNLEENIGKFDTMAEGVVGKQVAAAGASGIKMSGSAALAKKTSENNLAKDRENMIYNEQQRIAALRDQAAFVKKMGGYQANVIGMQQEANNWGTFGSILGSGSNLAFSFM